MSVIGNKALKKRAITLHGKKKPMFTKNLPLSVFELLTYENAKTHAKRSSWRNRTTLLNACILSAFHILSYPKPKLIAKPALCGKRKK